MIKFYRIKQINKDSYIPQVWEFPIGWKGIDRLGCNITFHSRQYQRENCTCNSLEQARSIIGVYQEYLKLIKQYPKYHKL